MQQRRWSQLGVTLVEILLVCAVSAMIVILAVRYYQNVTASHQAQEAMHLINAIIVAADKVRAGSGNYTNVNQTKIENLVGSLRLPWGSTVRVTGDRDNRYQIDLSPIPIQICTALTADLAVNTHIEVKSKCTGTGELILTYYIIKPTVSTPSSVLPETRSNTGTPPPNNPVRIDVKTDHEMQAP